MPEDFVTIPQFTESGDLPAGVHKATLSQVVSRFGSVGPHRIAVADRLQRIYHLALSTGCLRRIVIFGSFVTEKEEPRDVDVFLVMNDDFEVSTVVGEAAIVFDHSNADAHFGASVFWVRRLAAMGGEQQAIEHWQMKRGGGVRGIVEII